ncbi:DUF2946 family protein [Bradyrhizobium sp. Arg237L]|uniref:DUF2946 family protein n=1 Tax=Bradyrhizobium sp. Arg237L TaxID=3003352 RepID=UPI00249DC10D|nr:DUF2946 family protein [Bradyrhizobium sp. Arg237L]MDI4233484.1 DUF2946 family protein [Bradyrhizobium sp. Arg237L]
MRQRLQRFFLIALAVQILAPIATCWAAAIAISDPVGFAEICHSDSSSPAASADRDTSQRAHDIACLICCAAQANASFDAPKAIAFATPYRQSVRMVWHARRQTHVASRAGSNAQARAPPSIS